MIQRSAFAVIAMAAALASGPATAQSQSKWYGVASIGRSTIDVDQNSVNSFTAANGTGGTVTGASSNDIGFKLQLGYQMSNLVSLEGGYINLGTAEYTQTNPAYSTVGHKKADLWNLDLVARIPVNKSFSFLGRFGGYRWSTDSNMPTPAGMTNVSEDGYDFKLGAGAQYEFSPTFALRGEYERLNGVGKQQTTGDSKVNLFTVGAVLKF